MRLEVDSSIRTCYRASVSHRRRTIVIAFASLILLSLIIGAGIVWFTARLAQEQSLSSQRATAQAQAQQTAAAEGNRRATAQAQAQHQTEQTNALRLATLARQTLNAGHRPLAVTLALEANKIADPPLQAQIALSEVAYSPGFARDYGAGYDVSPDGKLLLDISAIGQVVLHDLISGSERVLAEGPSVPRITGQFLKIVAIGFSSDGARVILATNEHVVAWNIADGQQVAYTPANRAAICAVNLKTLTFLRDRGSR